MNYFITAKGVVPVEMDAHSLFIYMKLGVLGNSEVKTFNLFKELIELPSVVFRHRQYQSFDLHRDYNIISTGNYHIKEAFSRITENHERGRCSMVHHLTYEGTFGYMVCVYMIQQLHFDAMMRPALIDSILSSL